MSAERHDDSKALAVCAGVTAWALAYLGAAFLEAPRLAYFPAQHAVRFVTHAPPEVIAWPGLVLWGLVAGVDAAVVTLAAAGAARRAPSRTFTALCTGWTLLSLVLAAAYFVMRARA